MAAPSEIGQTGFLPVAASGLVETLGHRAHCARLGVLTSSMLLAAFAIRGAKLNHPAELDAISSIIAPLDEARHKR